MHQNLVGWLLLLVLAPAAHAGTVGYRPNACDGRGGPCAVSYRFAATPGERNDVDARIVDGALVLVDRGAPLRATSGCEQLDPQTARCAPGPDSGGIGGVTIEAGDGDDRVTGSAGTVDLGAGDDRYVGSGRADGGAGADDLRATAPTTLAGGPGDDVVTGSEGADVLGGGPGRDAVLGRGGDDRVQADDADVGAGTLGYAVGTDPAPDEPASDRLDGGPGRDVVSWARRRDGVRVDLRAARGGTGAEADRLTAFEVVHGSAGPDRLAGTNGDDELRGLQGDDILLGRGGDDVLHPSQVPGDRPPATRAERDVVRAGAGADTVLGVGAGTLSCGSGADVVDRRFRGGVALLPPDCEAVQIALHLGTRFAAVVPSRRRVGGRLAVRLRCPMRAGCHFHVTASQRGRSVLRRFATPFGLSSARVPVRHAGRVRLDVRGFPDGNQEPARVALDVR